MVRRARPSSSSDARSSKQKSDDTGSSKKVRTSLGLGLRSIPTYASPPPPDGAPRSTAGTRACHSTSVIDASTERILANPRRRDRKASPKRKTAGSRLRQRPPRPRRRSVRHRSEAPANACSDDLPAAGRLYVAIFQRPVAGPSEQRGREPVRQLGVGHLGPTFKALRPKACHSERSRPTFSFAPFFCASACAVEESLRRFLCSAAIFSLSCLPRGPRGASKGRHLRCNCPAAHLTLTDDEGSGRHLVCPGLVGAASFFCRAHLLRRAALGAPLIQIVR